MTMGGAGAVVGAMKALAGRKAKANVVGICGLVENMPDGNAQRPGDVVTTMSGQTVEVINTDAEGRLVLCDAITWTQQNIKPKAIVDLATLTGAMVITFGHEYAGIFANDEILAAALIKAADTSGDKLWRQPLADAYDRLIDSQIADMLAKIDRQLELGTNPVICGHQQRIFIARRLEVEKAAESAELGIGAGPGRRFR